MTKDQYLKEFKAVCENMIETTIKKNKDYTGTGDDPFYNFRLIEFQTKGRLTAEDGLETRMSDKMARVESYLAIGSLAVQDEGVADSLLDLAVYAILMSLLIKSRREEGHDEIQKVKNKTKR